MKYKGGLVGGGLSPTQEKKTNKQTMARHGASWHVMARNGAYGALARLARWRVWRVGALARMARMARHLADSTNLCTHVTLNNMADIRPSSQNIKKLTYKLFYPTAQISLFPIHPQIYVHM